MWYIKKWYQRNILDWLMMLAGHKPNQFHQFLWINGTPIIGPNTYIGGYGEIYAKGARVIIGNNCDIASFVAINCADSHNKTIEKSNEIEKKDIYIGNNVFIGSHCAILGGTKIGHHSVIGAGSIIKNKDIPPYSLYVNGEIKKL